jgi:PAS domain S-box-containing protein
LLKIKFQKILGQPRSRAVLAAVSLFIALSCISGYVAYADRSAKKAISQSYFAALALNEFSDVSTRIALRMNGLATIQTAASERRINADSSFDDAARLIEESITEYLAINLIDADRTIVRVWPREANRAALGQTVGQSQMIIDILDRARATGTPHISPVVDLFQGGKGIAAYYPVFRDGRFWGYVNGVFRIVNLDQIMSSNASASVAVTSYDIAAPEGNSYPTVGDPDERRFELPLFNQKIHFVIRDTSPQVGIWSDLPKIAGGLILSLTCSILLFRFMNIRSRAEKDEIMLASILKTAPVAVVSADMHGIISQFNSSAEAMFQRRSSDMIGKPLDILLPEASRHKHRDLVKTFAEGVGEGYPMGDWRRVQGLRADGTEFPLLGVLGRGTYEGEPIIHAVLRDMTSEQKAQLELKSLADDLQRALDSAKTANRAKTMFLATMSHELRTPLNAIIGFADMIGKEVFGPIGNEKYREYIADIHRSGENLLGLINDILDITKLDIGAFHIETTKFRLGEMLRSAIQVVSILASEKRIRIDVSEIAEDVTASADERATRQVALNLLANAIKFTGIGGLIAVRTLSGPTPGRVAFQVVDNGRGMSTDELGRVGQAFVQVGDSYQNKDQGSGLGLAICKSILAQMSGQLEIESTVGKGTTVTVTLPTEVAEVIDNRL